MPSPGRTATKAVPVPFVDECGSLLLIVNDLQRQLLLKFGGGCVALDARALGSVRLSGDFWPVTGVAARQVIDEIQACHAKCLNCPVRRLSQLVRLQVNLVELRVPGGDYVRVDLPAYVQAEPDWVLALGVQLQAHVNIAHRDEVLEAACALTGQQTEQVLAAQLDWVDGYGFEVSMIDETGGWQLRYAFSSQVIDPDRLWSTVQEGLARATALARRATDRRRIMPLALSPARATEPP